ncbi:tRNA lysidine(34) synthetase TilS [Thalassotalea sp. M1531]|uniref:tRNA(Ile)-lysidine synthase n=1 Tax=Thalassotalea algicola TaxID=2716224 RepID=A0A7Y0Q8I0_9GAMM|nr:tRNA lysidine(34) synthetase TilS [Thalassotalea algicola]NMP33246.1 tRNA lysidine(34) synthetase TilS [Thalassotalea algicola]
MKLAQQYLTNLLNSHITTPLVVAYSGGVDSQVLLHLLYQLKSQLTPFPQIKVCHVNHGLSENAEQWQEFAKQQCSQFGFEIEVVAVELDTNNSESIEALARDARYNVLTSLFSEPAIILTGHHLDDQTETFLLALKRGAGVKGLSAMAQEANLGKHQLIRPLLSNSRKEIESYATNHQLAWIEDESNSDSRYDRNFLRIDVLPLLNKRWQGFNQTVVRSAAHCRENQQLADEIASLDFEKVAQSSQILCLEELLSLSRARFNNVIRYAIGQLNKLMPSQAQLDELFSQLAAQHDKTPEIKLGQLVARRYNGNIFLTPDYKDLKDYEVTIDCQRLSINDFSVLLPDNLGSLIFSAECMQQNEKDVTVISLGADVSNLSLRFSHSNPIVEPDYRQHSRPLKKVLQELKLPPWQRKRIPFLYQNECLVTALGQFVCKGFLAGERSNQIYVRWLAPQ